MIDQDKSQNHQVHQAFKLTSSKLSMKIKTLTHDYYMIELPENKDHIFYQQFPFYLRERDYKGKQISVAPVARIYGTNQFGQKCCCHIHGYFSHFYIKAGQFSQAFTHNRQFVKQFLSLVEGLFQRAYSITKPIIMNAVAEQKIDFYGFHEKKETFLKIVVYDPSYVMRLRELLDSQIVGGRIFQCYQAHINYFMQLFSDNNIYGINELKILYFTFRRNIDAASMGLFVKIDTQTHTLFKEGFDLLQIENKYPQLFNCMEKGSSCYIQIDLTLDNIGNRLDPHQEAQPFKEQISMDSQMQSQHHTNLKLQFEVKITKALKEIWEDQRKRRETYGIEQSLEGIIDYSKNIEGQLSSGNQLKDPLWVNFVTKGSNYNLLTEMVKSAQRGQPKKQTAQISICREVAENYREVLSNQRNKLIEQVLCRWKYYGTRKKNMIDEIMKGQREQLPQWDDDKCSDSQSSHSSKSQQNADQIEQVKQIKSQAPKIKKLSNTALYRNNYKHLRAPFKKDSFFYICPVCKNSNRTCKCKNSTQKSMSFLAQTDSQKQSQQSTQQSQTKTQDFFTQYIQYSSSTEYQTKKIQYTLPPPTWQQANEGIVLKHQRPYYSDYKDLFVYYKINSQFESCLKNAQILDRELGLIQQYNRQPTSIKNQLKMPYYFVPICDQDEEDDDGLLYSEKNYILRYEEAVPTCQEVLQELKKEEKNMPVHRRSTSIKMSRQDTFVSDLVVMHYEFLVGFEPDCTRYIADPEKDQIICFSLHVRNFLQYRRTFKSLIFVEKYVKKQYLHVWEYDDIYFVKDEYDLLSMIVSIISRVDPDILVTFDQEKRGIRYLAQRGFAHGLNFAALISRSCQMDELMEFINFRDFKAVKQIVLTRDILLAGNILENTNKDKKKSSQISHLEQKLKKSLKRKPVLRQKFRFDIEVKGRVNISLYRICQQHLKLVSYTIQNICRHLFNQQIAEFTDKDLFSFYTADEVSCPSGNDTVKLTVEEGVNFVVGYLNKRLQIQAQIVTNLNIISVLVEKSKIFGSDIVSMMERGSQFKIEAVMCRVTKKLGYLTLSASKRQVGNQSVLQCIPLVLEPPKQFYPDPVLLFDFQSLYPSIMIAYNLCYSTCLGSLNNLFDKDKLKKLGVTEKMNISTQFLENIFLEYQGQQLKKRLSDSIFVTPNKVVFVKKSVKEGLLPLILLEFLISRIMIKNSEGLYKKTKIKKILKDRQYALKLFMNVMFGYTGASFTGRMPCSQIADSIVELSKYCLRQAIDFLNSHPKYKGKVLYGDTDSIFFNLPGYKASDTFKIGKQLALQMTAMFPYPIEMKFEKVYDGLFLVAKKRYYGKMYESENSKPKYEGKGLECVRRDGIELTRNLMRQMLDTLIDTKDLSKLKEVFKKQSSEILNNHKLENQFEMAKQVKLLKYGEKTCPAHGEAAKRLQKIDPMLVPKYGQRMKYFVTNGGLKAVKHRAIAVFEYQLNKNMSLDLRYYFNKLIMPPIQRVLSSLADLNQWNASGEYRHNFEFSQPHQLQINKKCLRCSGDTHFVLCQSCFEFVGEQQQKVEDAVKQSISNCMNCTGSQKVAQYNKCVEWNCRQLWRRRATNKNKRNVLPELVKLEQAMKQLNF